MATVYLATDVRHGRSVALKVLDATIAGSVGADRFLREIEIAARLTHPHIVPLFDSGAASPGSDNEARLLYYVMPFIAGESLRQRLERDGAMPLADVVRITREVASALDYAHRRGVVHRDIKPENVLLSEGHAVVADFGIARAVMESATDATLTQVGMIVGTPAYMSPEQATGSFELDARSDQYSLACVVFELLGGHAPFRGPTAIALLAQHATAPAPPLRTTEPVPDGVERAIHRAMSKTPGDRFPTVSAFAEAIAEGIVDAPAAAVRLPAGAAVARAPRIPVPLTPLLGREHEVKTILALLQRDGARLLTLSGPGGVGKTRLALHIAAAPPANLPDGAYFVPLTEARDADALNARIAQAVGLRGVAAGSPDALRDHLRERRALLVLDNFEHLVDAASVVSSLLADCPQLKALVTSQVLLRVYGEHEVPIEPLAIPDAHVAPRPREAARYPAVRLFMERATAARPDFVLDESNVAAVFGICTTLDGVPLAIELAAARVKSMTPQALLPKLRLSLDALSGGARDLPTRQQTMRGAIAWCHDLLSDRERAVFRRLAMFSGGVTAASAAAVCLDGGSVDDAAEVLASLADHSLVRPQTDATGDARYVMLRPVHAFTLELLTTAGEFDVTSDRHAAYFCDLVANAEPEVVRRGEGWYDRLDAERDNLNAAMRRLTDRGAVIEALRMGVALWQFWDARSYAREGLDAMRQALAIAPQEMPLRLRLSALYAAGVLADASGDYAVGRRLFEEHLEWTRQLGDPAATSIASNNLAILLLRQGDADAAIRLLEPMLSMLRDAGDLRAFAIGTVNIGDAERARGNLAAARVRYEDAIQLLAKSGDEITLAWTQNHLAGLAREEGNQTEARERCREALRLFTGRNNKRGMAAVLIDLGEMSASEGRLPEARSLLEDALAHVADAGDQRGMLRVIEALAGVAALGGHAERAVRLAGAVAGLRDRLGTPMSDAERDNLEARVLPAIAAMEEMESARVWRDGLDMAMEQVLQYVATPNATPNAI